MEKPTQSPDVQSLQPLVGTWTLEATHPAYPSSVVRGRAEFEWLEGEQFLLQRSRSDHPDFPDSLSVIGVTDERLSMHYFDSRGSTASTRPPCARGA